VDDAIDALMLVVAVLEKLNINYVIGGSYASSAHGEARSTNDIDILAAITVKQARALAAELQDKFTLTSGRLSGPLEQSSISMSSIWIRCSR